MKLKSKIGLVIFFIMSFIINLNAQNKNERIPFYALPYYNYEPLTITVGKYQKELINNNVSDIVSLENKIKMEIDNTDVESLYILSIRLYDLGKKDDAFYWFMTAQSRGRIVINMMNKEKIGSIGSPAFELKQLFVAFNRSVGEYMNGYGFNDIDKGLAVYEKVKSEIKNIKSYKNIYKSISFVSDDSLESEKTKKETELSEGIEYIKKNKELIKKTRIENGTQDKY